MPELPEVETVRTALQLVLTGRRIEGLDWCGKSLRWPLAAQELSDATVHRKVSAVRRRGKYLIVDFADDRPEKLLIHLGMTGSFRMVDDVDSLALHDHLAWRLEDGRLWVFNDPRRFGSVAVFAGTDYRSLPPGFRELGPEPLSKAFSGRYLRRLAKVRKQPVKSFLLDQSIVAGVGNIYANEALFEAGINPLRRINRVSLHRLEVLTGTVKAVLLEAIACGGTTIRDFHSLDGSEGHFSICLSVYGKDGEACPRCGPFHPIRRIVQAGRSTFYCPHCQH